MLRILTLRSEKSSPTGFRTPSPIRPIPAVFGFFPSPTQAADHSTGQDVQRLEWLVRAPANNGKQSHGSDRPSSSPPRVRISSEDVTADRGGSFVLTELLL